MRGGGADAAADAADMTMTWPNDTTAGLRDLARAGDGDENGEDDDERDVAGPTQRPASSGLGLVVDGASGDSRGDSTAAQCMRRRALTLGSLRALGGNGGMGDNMHVASSTAEA